MANINKQKGPHGESLAWKTVGVFAGAVLGLEAWESWLGSFWLESQRPFLEGALVLSHTSIAGGC